jgi:hypothetical protein
MERTRNPDEGEIGAIKIEDGKKKVGLLRRTFNNLLFKFNNESTREELAKVIEQNSKENEHDSEYVLTGKPGEIVTKRWFIKNEGNICWPSKVQINCLENKASVYVPAIDF